MCALVTGGQTCALPIFAGRRGLWLGGGGMRMVHAETQRRGENIETLKQFALSLSKGRSFLQRGRMKNSASTSSAQTVLGYSLRASASPREQISQTISGRAPCSS